MDPLEDIFLKMFAGEEEEEEEEEALIMISITVNVIIYCCYPPV